MNCALQTDRQTDLYRPICIIPTQLHCRQSNDISRPVRWAGRSVGPRGYPRAPEIGRGLGRVIIGFSRRREPLTVSASRSMPATHCLYTHWLAHPTT